LLIWCHITQTCRQECDRIDVSLRFGSDPDAEVDVGILDVRLVAWPDRPDRGTFVDTGALPDGD
jgi:hypothetical protein